MSTKQLFNAGAPLTDNDDAHQKLGQLDHTIQNSQRENKKNIAHCLSNRPYRREGEKRKWVSTGHWSRSTVQKGKRKMWVSTINFNRQLILKINVTV